MLNARALLEEFQSQSKTRLPITVHEIQWIPLHRANSYAHYQNWIQSNQHGDMNYLKESLPLKENPVRIFPQAQSILVMTCSYVPHPRPQSQLPGLRVAKYAQGEDYHFWFKSFLEEFANFLKSQFAGQEFFCGTDALPILERDYAAQSGLGWIGKNTCLIDQKNGSFHFIGEILSTQSFEKAPSIAPVPDFCGTCTRCIDVCPTGALEKPRVLNATKCISYWTIEAKEIPPLALREKFHDLFFGCDLCQSACPWNRKVFTLKEDPPMIRQLEYKQREELISSLKFILSSSNRELQKRLGETPLLRARPFGLRRNSIITATNCKLTELKSEIAKFESDPRLGELARWSLKILSD